MRALEARGEAKGAPTRGGSWLHSRRVPERQTPKETMPRPNLLRLALFLPLYALTLPAPSQSPTPAADPAQTAQAIRQWVHDFEGGRLSPKATLYGTHLQPRYVPLAQRAGFVTPADFDRLTHQDVLQRMLLLSAGPSSETIADAVLDVAGIGLEGQVLEHAVHELRDLGHHTLLRCERDEVWFRLLRTAAGSQAVGAPMPPVPPAVGDAAAGSNAELPRRIAALRLIGQRNLPAFRATLEAALVDADPLVRLATAESIVRPWVASTVAAVAAALAAERHPVAAQAQARLLLQMLREPPEDLLPDAHEAILQRAFTGFGRAGWRADMDLLEVVAQFPRRSAVEPLIALLDPDAPKERSIVGLVNKQASPLRRQRAGELLRQMTGAGLPADDAASWREFWRREKDKIVVPPVLASAEKTRTSAEFFGVPVSGGSIGFLIDTSGSMARAPAAYSANDRNAPQTRLQAARAQLLQAVQAMPPTSRFFVVTVADRAQSLSEAPLEPNRRNVRALTEHFGRIQPDSGTNLEAGLGLVLHAEGSAYGRIGDVRIDELFVLSDGEATEGALRDDESLLSLVREKNRYARIRIHCVFTGSGRGGSFLRRLAAEHGGVFVQR